VGVDSLGKKNLSVVKTRQKEQAFYINTYFRL
jgi:hypothetical protein